MFVNYFPSRVPQIVVDVITPDATQSPTLAAFLVMPNEDDDSEEVELNGQTLLMIL